MLRPLISIGCISVAGAVCAEPVPLTSESIKETLAGSLLVMDTPIGSTIPVRFSKDGLVSGEAGMLAGMLGAEKDRGRWWTKNDQLCVKWFRWFEAKPKCASLRQDGTRIYWRESSGETGTATLAERAKPAETTTVAAAEPAPKPQPPQATPVAPVEPEPAPAQQVATADAGPLIKQRSVTTEPLDKETPALMFAGMASLHEVATLTTPAETAPQAAPKIEADTEVQFARAPDGVSVLNQDSTGQPPNAVTELRPAKSAPPPSVPPRESESKKIVDIDAMGTDPMDSRSGSTRPSAREASFRVAGVRADDMLNVRSGPSENHQPVGRIPPAARGVKIVGDCRGDWCPIKRGGLKGWVNSYYLTEEW